MADADDEYGYRARFRDAAVEELIAAFNHDVGNPGWVRARMHFLGALREAFLATGLDCSSFVDAGSMSLRRRIRHEGDRIVLVAEDLLVARPAVRSRRSD
jgi:hypothetical protein